MVLALPGRVFGPGPLGESNSATRVLELYRRGRWRFDLGGRGSWVHVDDVVAGLRAAGDRGRTGRRYLLTGDNVTLGDFLRGLGAEAAPGASAGRRRAPRRPRGARRVLGGGGAFLADTAFSAQRAADELGWQARPVAVAVPRVIGWLEEVARGRASG